MIAIKQTQAGNHDNHLLIDRALPCRGLIINPRQSVEFSRNFGPKMLVGAAGSDVRHGGCGSCTMWAN